MPTRVVLASGFQPDYVREIANAYARVGVEPQVIGGDMHQNLQFEDGVRFHNLRGRDKKEQSTLGELKKLAAYYRKLLTFVASSSCPVLYDISIGRPFLRCLLMYTAFRLMGKRIVYTAHNVLPHDQETLLNKIIYWTIYRVLVDAIVVHGQSIKDRLVHEFGVRDEMVHVISHGTYHPANDPSLTKAAARDQLQLPHDRRVLLFFGLQRPYKGTDFAMKAIAENPPEGVTLLVWGHAGNPDYRKRLTDLAAAMPPEVDVNLRLESIPEPEMEAIFKASDIVVLPYLEGSQSGIKYMAYAYGRPVLASSIGSLGEFIVKGKTGETFSTGDSESFTKTLAEMLAALPRYGERDIQDIAYSEFSFEAAVRRVEDLIADLNGENTTASLSCGDKV